MMKWARNRYKVVKAPPSWHGDKGILWMVVGPGLYISSCRYETKTLAISASINLSEAFRAGVQAERQKPSPPLKKGA